MEGIYNLLKPPGMTSHDAVDVIRRITGVRRVGHAGTLDPAAAGVLPVFVGRAVRLVEYSADQSKAYRFEIVLGLTTPTLDMESPPDSVVTVDAIRHDQVVSAASRLVGRYEQLVPAFSAVKVGGRKLYEYSRAGEAVPEVRREVHVERLDVLDVQWGPNPVVLLDTECSKGTFVRALARDIGDILGVGAAVSFILRTRSGAFRLSDSHTFCEIEQNPLQCLQPIHCGVSGLPKAIVTPKAASALRFGRKPVESDYLQVDRALEGQAVGVFSHDNAFLAVGLMQEGSVTIRKVFCQ